MNKLYVLLLTIVISSCSSEVKLHPYTIIINKDELNALGTGFIPITTEDTIMVASDEDAYVKGLMHAEGNQRALNSLKNSHLGSGKVYYFKVLDSLYTPVSNKLGVNKIDSLNAITRAIADSTKAIFLFE